MLERIEHRRRTTPRGVPSGRTRQALAVVAFVLTTALAMAMPARADHVLAYTASASNCIPGNVVCARIDQEWRFHPLSPGNGVFTIQTTATGSALLLPGTLEASVKLGLSGQPLFLNNSDGCGWLGVPSECSVTLSNHEFAIPSGCVVFELELYARTRAVSEDPTFRLLSVTALAGQTLSACGDGTVNVL